MHISGEFIEAKGQLSWAALLAEVSSRCLHVADGQVDRAIDQCQRLVCDHLGVDHSHLWQAHDDAANSLLLTHLHRRTDGPSDQPTCSTDWLPGHDDGGVERQDIPMRTDANVFFPWIFTRARRGQTVVIADSDELPREAVRDREMLVREGIRSVVMLPLTSGGHWLGLLAFGMNRESRTWTELEVRVFRLTGDIFASALARIRTERALRDSELRLRLTAAAADADLWALDTASGEMSLGEVGRKILNLGPEDPCDYEKFLSQLYSEDREPLRSALQTVCETGKELSIESRVVAPDGTFRWISSRWCPVGTSLGACTRLVGASIDITERKEAQARLRRSAAENRELKERLKSESDDLEVDVKLNQDHRELVGRSRAIRRVLQQVEQVAPVSCPVLISGESGTGKELIAQSIHRLSPRGKRLMITVNCAALPAGLVESELFGRERGAFTGALSSQAGRFEMADQSTIFLDEVTELPLELQGKLLRVLQEGEFTRLGNPRTRKVDVRVIAATNRDLGEEVRKQRFREDLFYRLSVFPINLPPLRERVDDIPLLVFAFLEDLSSRMGKRITKVPRRVMETLERHYWPGNIRELRNVIERGVILSNGDTLRVAFSDNPHSAAKPVTLAEAERQHILATLQKTDWHIKGPRGAAKILDLKPGTLYSRMRKLDVPHRRQKDGMPTCSPRSPVKKLSATS
jgi:formate hydrogenlyase transcriptional activator